MRSPPEIVQGPLGVSIGTSCLLACCVVHTAVLGSYSSASASSSSSSSSSSWLSTCDYYAQEFMCEGQTDVELQALVGAPARPQRADVAL